MFAFSYLAATPEGGLSSVLTYKYAKNGLSAREIASRDYYEFIADTDGVAPGGLQTPCRIMSAAFSAIMITAALGWPVI